MITVSRDLTIASKKKKIILTIFSPDDTPWEGGTFKLSLEFTEEYPNRAPTIRFLSKMFHPNVYADGSICLDILQNQWSPIYDIAAILTSIQVTDHLATRIYLRSHCCAIQIRILLQMEKLLISFKRIRENTIVKSKKSWKTVGKNERTLVDVHRRSRHVNNL